MKRFSKGVALGTATLLVGGLFAATPAMADEADTVRHPRAKDDARSVSTPALAAGVIVKYRAGTDPTDLREAVADVGGLAAKVTGVAPRVRGYVTKITPLEEAVALAAALEKRSDVEWAEPNTMMQELAPTTWPVPTNDPLSSSLRNLWDTRGPEDAGVAGKGVTPWPAGGYGTKAPALWPATQGVGVTVAVVDTGIINHPDLAPNMVPGYDMITSVSNSNDGDGRDPDASDSGSYAASGQCGTSSPARNSSWHGTHVAGTIGAVANNATGVVGVAPGVKIQPVRVLGACGGSTADVAAGIVWAAGVPVTGLPANPSPAKVINVSLGGSGSCSTTFSSAINAARGAGAAVVVALGNDSADAAGFSPANCPGVIGVSSTSDYGDLASYSNYGAQADVSAPGGDSSWGENSGILSTVDSGTTVPAGPDYGWMNGTSMAAPAAAGVAALLSSVGQFNPDQLEWAMKASVAPFPTATHGGFAPCSTAICGTGVIDATLIPAPLTAPVLAGVPAVGQVLTATPGTWHGPVHPHALTWLADGVPVGTGAAYVVAAADAGKTIVVREHVTEGAYAPIGANSLGATVPAPIPPVVKTKKKAKLKVKLAKKRVRGHIKLIVKVKVKGVKKPKGKIKIKLTNKGKGKVKKNLKKKLKKKSKGTVTFVLPRLKRGKYKLKITYSGTKAISRTQGKYTLHVAR